jgi:hypothetical protein
MAVVQVQNVCDPTNTQNVWVANFTGVGVDEITKRTLPYQVAVATLAALCVVLFGGQLFGAPPFHVAIPPAAAATLAPAPAGLFAPASAARTIAIAHDADGELTRQIGAWPGYTAIPLEGDPAAADCSSKPYVAVLLAVDDGLQLEDCAGWPVDEWYEDKPATLSLVVRLRTWMLDHPKRAASLFERGLAYGGKDATPTYFYTLFKTNDGQMRAFVRPGGPAYAAGLRTNDIVEKIDGRFWWEYGTYPAQRRAYDGLPHAFVVQRDGRELEIRLGAPYRED